MKQIALAALVFPILASLTSVAGAASPVEVSEPAAGAELQGGSIAALRWDASPEFLAASRGDEWEAFLSLDGGRTFAFRITPHLEIARRRIAFVVPDFASSDARLLLRFGDERHETEVEIPQRLRIRPGSNPTRPGAVDPTPRPAGESARPGGRGVVAWIEGDRGGRGWQSREASPRSSIFGPSNHPRIRAGGHDEACDRTSLRGLGEPAASRLILGSERELQVRPAAVGDITPPRDILRLNQRQNE